MWELISPEVIETMFTSRDLVLHSVLFYPMCGTTSVSRTPLVSLTHKHIDGFVDGPLALVHYVK